MRLVALVSLRAAATRRLMSAGFFASGPATWAPISAIDRVR
jgi:hypothetical protein